MIEMKLKYLVLCFLTLSLAGCPRPQAVTPAEDEAQEERMRGFLNDSSPRNTNQQPKVTPEFKKNFNLKGNSGNKSSDTLDSETQDNAEEVDPEGVDPESFTLRGN